MLAERERLLLSREEAAKDKDNVIYQKDEILRHKNEKIAEHETTLAKLTLKVSFSGDKSLMTVSLTALCSHINVIF